jgi:hypothetical protein
MIRLRSNSASPPSTVSINLPCAHGNRVLSIDLRAEAEQLYLSWSSPIAGLTNGEGGVVTEIIPIVRKPCRFGGERVYFRCPESSAGCGQRAYKLYLARHHFLCRHCSGLVYRTPYEPRSTRSWQRAFRRANKLWQRLDPAAGIAAQVPEKPRAMPVATYKRLLEEALQAEMLADEARADWLRRFVAQIENRHKPQFTL